MGEIGTRKRGKKWSYYFEGAKIGNQRKKITKGGFSTKKEALEAGVRAANEYNQSGLHFVPSEISYSDYLDFWMENYCIVSLKKTTCDGYEKRIRLYIKPALGMYKLRAMNAASIQSFLNKRFNEGLSRNTLISLKSILSGSLNYAIEPMKFIQTDPMRGVKIPSTRAEPTVPSRKKDKQISTPEMIKAIFIRFPEGHTCHIPLQLAYRCGTRLGESFAFTWDDVDFDNATLDINKQVQNFDGVWTFTNPKYDSSRIIKLDSVMLSILQREKARQEKAKAYYAEYFTEYCVNEKRQIIKNGVGTKIEFINRREDGSYIQPRVMQHCSAVIHQKLNNPEFDYHSLRHTHTTLLIEAGANPKDVQHRLGHKDIKVTLGIYAALTQKMQHKSIEILESVF